MEDQVFNEGIASFHLHLVEEKFDNAIHLMFEMEKGGKGDEVRREVVQALKIKLKNAMLRSLRKKLWDDKIDESFVMWDRQSESA